MGNFSAHMEQLSSRWSEIRLIFTSTDDSDVVSDAALDRFRRADFSFNWTLHEMRWPGGSPTLKPLKGHGGHHANDPTSVSAVLKDIMGLARATVLVGNMDS